MQRKVNLYNTYKLYISVIKKLIMSLQSVTKKPV